MNRKIFFFSLIIALCQIIRAQVTESIPETLTIDYCMKKALETNYTLVIQRESIEKSQAARLGAWSDFMPGASARFSWSRSDEDRYSFGESGPVYSKDYYNTGLSVSQTIFAGGRNLLDLKSSYIKIDEAINSYSDTKADVIFRVKTAYYYAVSAKKTADNADNAYQRAKDQMSLVAHRDSLGLADPTEVSQMKVNLAQTELASIQSRNAAKKAMETLLALLPLPLESEAFLSDEFSEIDETRSLDGLLENAFRNNKQIKSAELEVNLSKLSRMSSWTPYLPGLSASFSYSWGGAEFPSSFRNFDREASYSYGISANWTLFAGTSRIASIRNANSGVREAEIRLAQTKQNVEVSVRDAYRKMVEAIARRKLASASLENAVLNSSLFREKYALGNCTLLELLQAELDLQKAQSEAISAEFDYRLSIAELERLSGAE